MKMNNFKVYKEVSREAKDSMGCTICKFHNGLEEINIKNVVIDRIKELKIVFTNGQNLVLNQISDLYYDTDGYIDFEHMLLNLEMNNAFSNELIIENIFVSGSCINVYNPEEILTFTCSFDDKMKIKNIISGLSTSSTMHVYLEVI